MNIYNIENEINTIQAHPTYHEMERINELITRVLNISQKKVEGIKRNISLSKEKEIWRGKVLFWKVRICQLIGGIVDIDSMNKWKELYQIECNNKITLEELKENLNKAKQK